MNRWRLEGISIPATINEQTGGCWGDAGSFAGVELEFAGFAQTGSRDVVSSCGPQAEISLGGQ